MCICSVVIAFVIFSYSHDRTCVSVERGSFGTTCLHTHMSHQRRTGIHHLKHASNIYHTPMKDSSLEPSVFLLSDTENQINKLRFSESVSLSFKTRLTLVRPSLKKMVCRAPTYPPKTGPTQFFYCLSKIFLNYSLNAVNKYFFKIIKSCISIEAMLHRLLLYAFLPYIQNL